MADAVIYKIQIGIAGDGKAQKATENSKATEDVIDPDKQFQKGLKKIAGFYASTALVRNAVKTGVGLMDVYTGNSYQQSVIEGGIGIAEKVIGTGLAFAINPIAGAMAVASEAISVSAGAIRQQADLTKQQIGADLVRDRAGGAFNRSRASGRF